MELNPEQPSVPTPENTNQTPVPPTPAPAPPKLEGTVWRTAKPAALDWIAPEDVKPVKGFDSWYLAMFERGPDGKEECGVAAIDAALIRLKISGEVSLSATKPVIVNVKQFPSDAEGRDLAFNFERGLKLTPEVAGKIVFLLQIAGMKVRPVIIKDSAAKKLNELVIEAIPEPS